MPSLTSLDDDALGTVLSLCDLPTIASAASTCRRIADLLSNPNQIPWHTHLCRNLKSIPGAGVSGDALELATDAKALLRGALWRYWPKKLLSTRRTLEVEITPEEGQGGQFQVSSYEGGPRWEPDEAGEDYCYRSSKPFPPGASPCTVVRRKKDRDRSGGHRVALSTVSYFEVEISQRRTVPEPGELPGELGRTPCIAIGLATKEFRLHDYQPGWTRESLGYHGDDGCIYHGNGASGEEFGPTFSSLGDVVGCGLHRPTGSVFFTFNGALVGTAFVLRRSGQGSADSYPWSDVRFYPVMGIDSISTTVTVNFGAGAPFKFDPERMVHLYDKFPPVVEQLSTPQQRTASSQPPPSGFVCTYPVASSRHPWSPTALTRVLEVVEDMYDEETSSDDGSYLVLNTSSSDSEEESDDEVMVELFSVEEVSSSDSEE